MSGSLTPSAQVDIFDSVSNTWTTTSLVYARYNLAGATVNGNIAVFAGGYTNVGGTPGIIDFYNFAQNKWTYTYVPTQCDSLYGIGVGTLGLFAGCQPPGHPINLFQIFNSVADTWTNSTAPLTVTYIGTAAIGYLALFAGGNDLVTGLFSTAHIYNTVSSSWSNATLSSARQYLAGSGLGSYAVFAGGEAYDRSIPAYVESETVDIFDSETGVWDVANISQARYSLVGTTVGDQVLFAGGVSSSGNNSAVVDIFTFTTISVTTGSSSSTTTSSSSSSGPSPSAATTHHSCAALLFSMLLLLLFVAVH